ncbi:Cytochrome b-c1 complex subunit 2, mitochondrial [Smittium mucronatum]|uniref:Cytochrome b-c1 complex subunit 2, mitochondrial n=1 Tax=Smittium mucronatum TaxID=133383 RepID=A0A1R0GPC4_9FUNG|nr:Cytochrome b-c1 complex subunit 2, mitochondrial [Smittium mucronatum]
MLRLSSLKQSLKTRSFSSAAAGGLKNNVKVVGLESQKPYELGSVSVVLNMGSRFEKPDQAGVAHYLKAFGFRNSKEKTGFRKVREAELQGAMLTSELTRENVIYTVECFKQDIPYFFEMINEMTTKTLFNSWEFEQVNSTVLLESSIAASNPLTVLSEQLHHAIYRTGLGNSLYASPSNSINSSEIVKNYLASRFTAENVAILGSGISTEQLSALVSSSDLSALPKGSSEAPAKSKFHAGSEIHTGSISEFSHYALAFEAPDAATARLLAEFLGSSSGHIKYSSGISPLSKVASEFPGSSVSSFTNSYSDSSIVGILVSSPSAQLRSVLDATVKQVRALADSQISPESFGRAVSCARMYYLNNIAESASGTRAALASTAFSSPCTFSQQLDSASLPTLQAAVKSTFSSKPAAASVGNSMLTPYLDTIL